MNLRDVIVTLNKIEDSLGENAPVEVLDAAGYWVQVAHIGFEKNFKTGEGRVMIRAEGQEGPEL
jgi:hypothetical protein